MPSKTLPKLLTDLVEAHTDGRLLPPDANNQAALIASLLTAYAIMFPGDNLAARINNLLGVKIGRPPSNKVL